MTNFTRKYEMDGKWRRLLLMSMRARTFTNWWTPADFVIQHNVQHWHTKRQALCNIYIREDPHVILINLHGLTDEHLLKIQNYRVHKYNSIDNEQHNSRAIVIRQDVKYKLIEEFCTDILGIKIDTREGPIHVITTYISPRQQHIHYPDFYNALTK